jgi:hypothetical protein
MYTNNTPPTQSIIPTLKPQSLANIFNKAQPNASVAKNQISQDTLSLVSSANQAYNGNINDNEAYENSGKTTLADWADNTGELAKTSPIKIPENATIKSSTKTAGYDQISYKWVEGGYTYEARWHTKTPGAPTGQINTWVVSRVTQGTPTGQRRVLHIMVGNTWVTRHEWQAAITAYQNGTMTAAQEAMLKAGHWLAP